MSYHYNVDRLGSNDWTTADEDDRERYSVDEDGNDHCRHCGCVLGPSRREWGTCSSCQEEPEA